MGGCVVRSLCCGTGRARGHCLRDGWLRELPLQGRVWQPIHLPEELPHASPAAEPGGARAGSVEGCPPGLACGQALPTGMPHEPQRARSSMIPVPR